MLGVLDS
jgi:hypothetical protein